MEKKSQKKKKKRGLLYLLKIQDVVPDCFVASKKYAEHTFRLIPGNALALNGYAYFVDLSGCLTLLQNKACGMATDSRPKG